MHTSLFPTLRADVVQQSDLDWSAIVAMCQSPQLYPTKQACRVDLRDHTMIQSRRRSGEPG